MKCYSYGWRDTGAQYQKYFIIRRRFSIHFFCQLELWDGISLQLHCERQCSSFLTQNPQKYDFSKSKYSPNISSLFPKYIPNIILTINIEITLDIKQDSESPLNHQKRYIWIYARYIFIIFESIKSMTSYFY